MERPEKIPQATWDLSPEAQAMVVAVIAACEARIAGFEARFTKDSSNSSWPPLQNPPHLKPAPPRQPSGKRCGGAAVASRGLLQHRTGLGTDSPTGSRPVEQLLTRIESCRRQGRNLLAFLFQAVGGTPCSGNSTIAPPNRSVTGYPARLLSFSKAYCINEKGPLVGRIGRAHVPIPYTARRLSWPVYPNSFGHWVQPMADAFARPTFKRFFTLMAAAVLNTGRHTVSNLLRTAGGLATGYPSSYQRRSLPGGGGPHGPCAPAP